MDRSPALTAFAALGQTMRIDAFRLLMKAGSVGMLLGEGAAALGVRQNTMSATLWVLLNAGLLRNRCEGRAIHYFTVRERVSGLLGFLLEDCCGGHPEQCQFEISDIACRG